MGLRGPKPASLEEARRNRARVRPRNVSVEAVRPVGTPIKRMHIADDPVKSQLWDEIVPRLVDKARVGEDDSHGLECLVSLLAAERAGDRPNHGEIFRWLRAFGMIPDSPVRARDVKPKSLNNVEQFLRRAQV